MTTPPVFRDLMPVSFDYVAPDALQDLARGYGPCILGAIIHGADDLPSHGPWPQVPSHFRTFDEPACLEVLTADEPVTYDQSDGLTLAMSEHLLFAACDIAPSHAGGLSSLSESLYRKILAITEARGYPHILRMWNSIADINGDQGGVERYKLFCQGRHEAFQAMTPALAERYPSACALGSHSGELCVYLLAARDDGRRLENPNQISAYHYPLQYGPKSPSFSRALYKQWPQGDCLFISGTASVVGHQSRHLGQTACQVEEALQNVQALVSAAEAAGYGRFDVASRRNIWKVYIRRAADYPLVRATLERAHGTDLRVLYLEADICRDELLFELDVTLFAPGRLSQNRTDDRPDTQQMVL